MKTTKVLFITLLIAAMVTMPQSAKSQVTIGSSEEPQPFSLLELISNEQHGQGLRLPQLTNGDLIKLTGSDDFVAKKNTEARGLTIYNSTRNCVQYWNSTEWVDAAVRACLPVPLAPVISDTQKVCSTGTVADLSPSGLRLVQGSYRRYGSGFNHCFDFLGRKSSPSLRFSNG
jgi:hypothetical protein